uniref:PHD-type domain-containing protein n=1 Tax=Nothoprocta perdicaria TaxID=30464 RepID=A0A8C6ZWS5_NOTPE
MGAYWDTPINVPACPLHATGHLGSRPTCAPARLGQNQAFLRAGCLSRTLPQALGRCSLVAPFALCSAAYLLCHRADVSVDVCGPKHQQQGICVHECCLVGLPAALPAPSPALTYSASGLEQRGTEEQGICGFLPADIKQKAKSAAHKRCFACGERGACISCQVKGCSRSFHLPCTSKHGCVTQFFRKFKSFCWEHQPEPDTTCIMYLEPVEEQISHTTMVCPACKGAWFHLHLSCFRCPHCNNKSKFVPEMLRMGFFIPLRVRELASPGCQRQHHLCFHRPWELLLCSSCASKGTHRCCSALGTAIDTWECDECAALLPCHSPSSLKGPAEEKGSWRTGRKPASLQSSKSTRKRSQKSTACLSHLRP